MIMLLIALLLPALGKTRDAARDILCQSNLRQMGVGVQAYCDDHRYFPPGYLPGVAVWPTLVRAYTGGNTDVFYCPTAEPETRWVVQYGSGQPASWGYDDDEVRLLTGGAGSMPFSYGHNNDGTDAGYPLPLGVGDTFGDGLRYVLSIQVMEPSQFFVIADTLVDGVWDHFIDEDVPGEEPAVRHHDGAFFLTADIHVEWLIPGPFLDPANTGANDPSYRRRWNNDNLPH